MSSGPEVGRDPGARAPARQRRQGRAAAASRGLPAGRLSGGRRGLPLQRDRRDHGYADRHRDVPAASRPSPAEGAPAGLRTRSWARPRRCRVRGGGAVVTAGADPAENDCSATLKRLFLFIDNEMDQASNSEIQEHLDDCAPCLAKYDLERLVKMLVARSCCRARPVQPPGPGAPLHPPGAADRERPDGGKLTHRGSVRELVDGSPRRLARTVWPNCLAVLPVKSAPLESRAGPSFAGTAMVQALGRLPWLALFLRRARRLRPFLDMLPPGLRDSLLRLSTVRASSQPTGESSHGPA